MNIRNIVSFFSKRKWVLVALFIVTPAGFLSKSYSGTGHKWFNEYAGGVLYEVFWCLVVFFFAPKKKYATTIALAVLLITCILETLQLWQPLFLQQVRSSFLGKALLGTTFVWWDFPHYVLGCLIGWLCMRAISKKSEEPKPP
jgi:hypothetical protein